MGKKKDKVNLTVDKDWKYNYYLPIFMALSHGRKTKQVGKHTVVYTENGNIFGIGQGLVKEIYDALLKGDKSDKAFSSTYEQCEEDGFYVGSDGVCVYEG